MRQYEPVKGHFPYTAVISVTLCLFANNYAITSCFAYTGAMVVHLGAAATRDEAGYSAGLLAASFMIGRGMTALVWGLLADKYGRRPVLITCCLAMVVFQLIFGFATSFGMAIAGPFSIIAIIFNVFDIFVIYNLIISFIVLLFSILSSSNIE